MPNPFENEDAEYFVLINDEGQHSLWPAFAEIPAGWRAVHGQDSRAACLEYVEKNWTDMRPLSLVREMDAAEAS
ncbi:MbtH family protein [Paractinoplanes brasiliensis]|uniref:MbtH protein n=1 Tax=Paractinoplanes brasiliensis TaxID=52695 RepID=A0A4R6JZ23_9ACTN|nr:MbtH family protein [Actinoplanes brasiliensis]TDO42029.1 MbtH protein [Actinoplanes brasiliensis]